METSPPIERKISWSSHPIKPDKPWVEIQSNLIERICAVSTTTQKDTPEA